MTVKLEKCFQRRENGIGIVEDNKDLTSLTSDDDSLFITCREIRQKSGYDAKLNCVLSTQAGRFSASFSSLLRGARDPRQRPSMSNRIARTLWCIYAQFRNAVTPRYGKTQRSSYWAKQIQISQIKYLLYPMRRCILLVGLKFPRLISAGSLHGGSSSKSWWGMPHHGGFIWYITEPSLRFIAVCLWSRVKYGSSSNSGEYKRQRMLLYWLNSERRSVVGQECETWYWWHELKVIP
jgi:hypothetical protein